MRYRSCFGNHIRCVIQLLFHLLQQVVPVFQDSGDGPDPALHESHVAEDLQLLFLGLPPERIPDADEMLPHLLETHIGVDFPVRKMLPGTVAQGASTHVVTDRKAAFLGLATDGFTLFPSDPRIQVHGAAGAGFGHFFLHC